MKIHIVFLRFDPVTKFHEYWTENVPVECTQGKKLTTHNTRCTKDNRHSTITIAHSEEFVRELKMLIRIPSSGTGLTLYSIDIHFDASTTDSF